MPGGPASLSLSFGGGGCSVDAATWDNCWADFAFDGALIDLLAPGTGKVHS